MKIWRCDGENDCEDGFDESDCSKSTEFTLYTGTPVLNDHLSAKTI
jgi:hypothetical protein